MNDLKLDVITYRASSFAMRKKTEVYVIKS